MKNLFKNKIILLITLATVIVMVIFGITKIYANLSDTKNAEIYTEIHNIPPRITDIVIDDITCDSAKIYWETDIPSICVMFYGPSIYYAYSREESELFTSHYFNLSSLLEDTLYHFKIYCTAYYGETSSTSDYTFKTLICPGPPTPIGPITPSPYTPAPTPISPSPTTIVTPTPPYEAPISIPIIITPTLIPWALYIITALVLLGSIFLFLEPLIMNLPFLSLWDWILGWIHSWFIWIDKRKKWGIVYDSESGEPIAGVTVRIFSLDKNKVTGIEKTNNRGRYRIEVEPGNYTISVEKTNYTYPSKKIHEDYHGEPFVIKNDESLIIVNIPIDPDLKKLSKTMNWFNLFGKLIDWLRTALMIAGTILAILYYIWYPSLFYMLFVILYALLWILELVTRVAKPRSFGSTLDKLDKSPLPLTIVRVYDDEKKRLVATKVTDSEGHYVQLVPPGDYRIKATKVDYETAELQNIALGKNLVVNDIFLNKVKSENEKVKSEENSKEAYSNDKVQPVNISEEPETEKPTPVTPAVEVPKEKPVPTKVKPAEVKPESPKKMSENEKLVAEEAPIVHGPVAPVVVETPKPETEKPKPEETEPKKPAKSKKPKKRKKKPVKKLNKLT